MKKKHPNQTDFPGFSDTYDLNRGSGSFIMYPLILEEYWHLLTGAEQKVLDFIIRQTIGWRKTADVIAWSQFANGVGGKSKGKGTGLSVSQIRRAVNSIEKKGFIKIQRRKNRPHLICLVIEKSDFQKNMESSQVFKDAIPKINIEIGSDDDDDLFDEDEEDEEL